MKRVIHANFIEKTLTPVMELDKKEAYQFVAEFNSREIPNHRLFTIDNEKFNPKKHGYFKFRMQEKHLLN